MIVHISISQDGLYNIQIKSLVSNFFGPVTKEELVTTLYPICSRAFSKLLAGGLNSTLRFLSSLKSEGEEDFSVISRISFVGRPFTRQEVLM